MNIKINKWILGVAALSMGMMAVSCEDEPDKYQPTSGVPVVKYIRVSDPEKSDSLVVSAYLNNTIVLVGDNLKSIHEMYFNDQKAILNTSYITDHTMIVDIPNNIPDVVTDKIYMINWANDTITYDFKVNVPAPQVTSLSCEWVKPGDEAIIYGDYLIDDPNYNLEITMPGNVDVPYENIKSITKNAVTFVVPENATTEGQISVSTIYGSGRSTFMYHDSRGMLFDFDGKTGLDFANNCWHARATVPEDATSLTGAYIQFGDANTTMSADGGWNDSSFSAEYWPGSWDYVYPTSGQGMKLTDLVDFSDFANMSLKFEILIPSSNPWMAGAMQIIPASTDYVSLTSANNTYFHPADDGSFDYKLPRGWYCPWSTTGSYDTADEWITVTIPFSNFVYDWDGTVSPNALTSKSFESLLIFIVNGPTGKECQPIIKMDNIRAVPNL